MNQTKNFNNPNRGSAVLGMGYLICGGIDYGWLIVLSIVEETRWLICVLLACGLLRRILISCPDHSTIQLVWIREHGILNIELRKSWTPSTNCLKSLPSPINKGNFLTYTLCIYITHLVLFREARYREARKSFFDTYVGNCL